MIQTPIDEYQKKVMAIALSQCRCGTGADLVTEKRKDETIAPEYPEAA